MKFVRFIVLLLVIIGALNWGLIGFFQYDFVADMFGGMSTMLARVVYALVGIAGLLSLKCLFSFCCSSSCGGSSHDGSGCGCSCHKGHSCHKDK